MANLVHTVLAKNDFYTNLCMMDFLSFRIVWNCIAGRTATRGNGVPTPFLGVGTRSHTFFIVT